MRVAIPLMGALVLLAWAASEAQAIVPCIKEHRLETEFVDEDTGGRGRMRYRADLTEMAMPVEQYEMSGAVTLVDVVSGKKLSIEWEALAASAPLAHASYLAAVDVVLFRGGRTASGITLRDVRLRGRNEFTGDDLLRMLALVASSYGAIGGPDYAAAVLDVATELNVPLPDLMQRAR